MHFFKKGLVFCKREAYVAQNILVKLINLLCLILSIKVLKLLIHLSFYEYVEWFDSMQDMIYI